MLSHVWESLSGLSYQYINKVWQESTSKEHLCSFKGIKLLTKEVSFYQQVYNCSSQALANLDPEMKSRYPMLRWNECTISAAISNVNAWGQSQIRLPWFWATLDGWDGENTLAHQDLLDNDHLLECMYLNCGCIFWNWLVSTVYYVSWMWAHAQWNYWEEELPQTQGNGLDNPFFPELKEWMVFVPEVTPWKSSTYFWTSSLLWTDDFSVGRTWLHRQPPIPGCESWVSTDLESNSNSDIIRMKCSCDKYFIDLTVPTLQFLIMADTIDLPPTFIGFYPLPSADIQNVSLALKIRHHFFLIRFKLALQQFGHYWWSRSWESWRKANRPKKM
jgi:hypothetical protein